MMFAYSLKVLLANFGKMWKLLLFRLIVLLICLSIAVGIALPNITYIFGLISETGFFENFGKFFGAMLTSSSELPMYSELISNNFVQIGNILISNMSKLILTYVYLIAVLCISRFLNGIADFAVAELVQFKMSAFADFGFVDTLFKSLGKSVRFSLAKVMFTVPFDVIVLTVMIALFVVLISPLGIFMPFVLMLLITILMAFRMTLFGGWMPAVVADGYSVFGGLKKGVKCVFTRFWKTYSSWVLLILLGTMLGILFVILTFGVGIIVLFPSFILFQIIFYFVMYYGAEGRRYYIDHETIVTPKKLYDTQNRVSAKIKSSVFYDNTKIDE